MELDIMYKIKSNKKHYDYLRKYSYWYKLLNRDSNNYKLFLNAYKKYNRNITTNKVTDSINNIDMITNVLKILE